MSRIEKTNEPSLCSRKLVYEFVWGSHVAPRRKSVYTRNIRDTRTMRGFFRTARLPRKRKTPRERSFPPYACREGKENNGERRAESLASSYHGHFYRDGLTNGLVSCFTIRGARWIFTRALFLRQSDWGDQDLSLTSALGVSRGRRDRLCSLRPRRPRFYTKRMIEIKTFAN